MSFTERTKAPFRLDVVGSFLRLDAIKEARAAYADGAISAEQLKAVEDRCITELVEKELAAGLRCVTDGEFRRSYWHLDFMWGFEGVEHIVGEHGYFFHDEETRADTGRIVAPIRFNGHPFLEHFKFLRDLVGDRAIPRQTIPAPAQFYNEMLRGTNCDSLDAVYPTREAFREDLIKAYSDFIHALYEAGCRSLQLDDCTWGMLCDTERRKALYGGQTDADAVAQLYVDLNNAVIDCVPRGMVVNTHICRGNYHSTWASSGGYAPVSKILFGKERTSKENQTTGGNVTPSNLTEIKGGAENTYYYDKDSMENVKEVVNIQQAGYATEPGIYVNVPAGISDVKVNGVALDATAIQGAGTWIYLSKLTKRTNNVEIT